MLKKKTNSKTKGKKERERERDKLPRTLFAYSTPRLPFSFTSFHQRLFNSPVGRKFFSSFDTGDGGLLSTFVFHFFPSHSLSSISTVTSASQHFEKRMKKNHHHKSFLNNTKIKNRAIIHFSYRTRFHLPRLLMMMKLASFLLRPC